MNDTSTLQEFALSSTLAHESTWDQTLGQDLEEV